MNIEEKFKAWWHYNYNNLKGGVAVASYRAGYEQGRADMTPALSLAEATIQRLQRHAPGSADGTLDVIRAALRGES